MDENRNEGGPFMQRLRSVVMEAAVRHLEIERLLGLAPGGWQPFAMGRGIEAMTALQETRSRLALELLCAAARMLGSWTDVGRWLVAGRPELDGLTPVAFAEDLRGLRTLVQAIKYGADND